MLEQFEYNKPKLISLHAFSCPDSLLPAYSCYININTVGIINENLPVHVMRLCIRIFVWLDSHQNHWQCK